MNRRSLLKGAIIAAATPAVTFAPALANDIQSLVGSYIALDKAATEVGEIESSILKSPGRVPYPFVSVGELDRRHFLQADKNLYSRVEIEEFFDEEEGGLERQCYLFGRKETDRRLARSRVERRATLELFDQRNAPYQKWRETSGFRAVQERTRYLFDAIAEVEDQILGFPCGSFEDFRCKAGFVQRAYGETVGEERLAAIVKGFLA